jgi:hypothetical protein
MRTILVAFVALSLLMTSYVFTGCSEEGDNITVNVPNDQLQGLVLELVEGYLLAPNLDCQLRCIAQYQDFADQDWTSLMSWAVSDPTWADINAWGVLRPKRTGVGEVLAISPEGWFVRANFNVNSIEHLTITLENSVLLKGEESGTTLTARLSNGQSQVVSSWLPVSWSFTDPSVAHMTSDGAVHADKVGQTVVTASLTDVNSYPVALTVDSVTSMTTNLWTPAPYLPLDTLVFHCNATMVMSGTVDVSDRVTWVASDPAHLLHVGNGVFFATAAGAYTVNATLAGITSASEHADVWDVTALQLTPGSVTDTLNGGDTLRFIAMATVTDHPVQNLTNRAQWISTSPSVGVFISPGFFQAGQTGVTEVYAQVGFVTSSRITIYAQRTALFTETFEGYPLGTFTSNSLWQVSDGGSFTGITIVSPGAGGSAKSCMISDSNSSNSSYILTQSNVFGQVYSGSFEVDVRPPQTTSEAYIRIDIMGTGMNSAIFLEFYGGTIYCNSSSVGAYANNQWIHVRAEFDCSNDYYDLYIDGDHVRDNAYFYYTQSSIGYVRIASQGSSGYMYVDNVLIDEAPTGFMSAPRGNVVECK